MTLNIVRSSSALIRSSLIILLCFSPIRRVDCKVWVRTSSPFAHLRLQCAVQPLASRHPARSGCRSVGNTRRWLDFSMPAQLIAPILRTCPQTLVHLCGKPSCTFCRRRSFRSFGPVHGRRSRDGIRRSRTICGLGMDVSKQNQSNGCVHSQHGARMATWALRTCLLRSISGGHRSWRGRPRVPHAGLLRYHTAAVNNK